GCNPTSSKFIHTWLRFGEIMRGSLSAAQPPKLEAQLVKVPGTDLTQSPFRATGTLVAEYW
ncbi:hypothetical protein Q4R80_13290, partial [Morganella morganii]